MLSRIKIILGYFYHSCLSILNLMPIISPHPNNDLPGDTFMIFWNETWIRPIRTLISPIDERSIQEMELSY